MEDREERGKNKKRRRKKNGRERRKRGGAADAWGLKGENILTKIIHSHTRGCG
jgi:hypothetical protein